eukprot:CAMPEP_0117603886 /NCGR_PEP_ID=MMETSP0784-20121206/78395_1 /TAXON_ID=39447 /ORGANISM="" /LENGTH=114 /DNA_ID=CAMNT_0005406885 /DNA_START=173 /DNA_END=513 /DNA_ORIENTATION=-
MAVSSRMRPTFGPWWHALKHSPGNTSNSGKPASPASIAATFKSCVGSCHSPLRSRQRWQTRNTGRAGSPPKKAAPHDCRNKEHGQQAAVSTARSNDGREQRRVVAAHSAETHQR